MFNRPKYMVYFCQVKRPPNFPKPSCVREGKEDLMPYLQQKVMQDEKMMEIAVTPTGCLNRCQFGPVMIVEPGSYMYVDLDKEKLDRIYKEHLKGGNPVREYLIPEEFWSEPKEG